MDTSQLDSLIVRNLADLDATARRIADIEARVWRDLGEIVEDWAKAKGWAAGAEQDDVWLAPRKWLIDGEPQAWFTLQWGPGDEGEQRPGECYFDLSRLSGAAGGRLCLWLEYEDIGARAWKAAMADEVSAVTTLGFVLTDRLNAFVDCTPDTAAVADGLLDDDLTAALAPVGRALDLAAEAWPLFDSVLKTARKA